MEENNSKEKEINLLQLISIFIQWLKNVILSVLNIIVYLLRLSFRKKFITISVVILTVCLGLYLSRPSARIYKAEAMAFLYGAGSHTVKDVSTQIENSLPSNKLYSLSTKLSLPDSIAKNIVSFQSFYVISYYKNGVAEKVDLTNSHNINDTLNVKLENRLYFQLQIKKINQLPKIQAAVLNYFNTNPVMISEFMSKRNEYINRIEICNVESKRIDSLAKISYYKSIDQQLKFDNNKLLLGDQRKQLFYDDLIRLNDIKSNSELTLSTFKEPVVLSSGFVISSTPINSRFKYLIYSLVGGYLISLLIAGLFENLKKIMTFLNK